MKELEDNVRAITMDGLVWGGSKRVPVGYGIHKLQVNLVVEDEKVSLEDLQGQIEGDEDHVQSTDVVRLSPLYLGISADRSPGGYAKAVNPQLFRYGLPGLWLRWSHLLGQNAKTMNALGTPG